MKTITQQLSTLLPIGKLVNNVINFFRKKTETVLEEKPVKKVQGANFYERLPDKELVRYAESIVDRMFESEAFPQEQIPVLYLSSKLKEMKHSLYEKEMRFDMITYKVKRKELIRQLNEVALAVKRRAANPPRAGLRKSSATNPEGVGASRPIRDEIFINAGFKVQGWR